MDGMELVFGAVLPTLTKHSPGSCHKRVLWSLPFCCEEFMDYQKYMDSHSQYQEKKAPVKHGQL